MESSNKTFTHLPLLSCHLIDLPDTREDCSIYNESECIKCPILGRFMTGEGINDFFALGHTVCFAFWILTSTIGTFGTFTNCLIIAILNRRKSARAFDTLLIALACFDLVTSLSAVVGSTAAITYFRKLIENLYCLYRFLVNM